MGGSTIHQLQHPCREGGRGRIRDARGEGKGRRREYEGGGTKRLGVKEEAEEVDEMDEMGEIGREGLRTQSIVITCMSWKTQECQGHMGALPLMQP